MDPLILIVVTAFIITAVFVGYHAAQESREEMVEGHIAPSSISSLNNQLKQTTFTLFINTYSFQI